MQEFEIKPITEEYKDWIEKILKTSWGSVKIITRGKIHEANKLPGFIAVKKNEPIGLITYKINNNECEIVSLDSIIEGIGVGSALLEGVKSKATEKGCKRLWIITSNDNTRALRFYQKKGFIISAFYKNAIKESRKLKPEIPLTGIDGIPIKDEIELESVL